MDFITATVVFCLLIAVIFLGLWLFYDRRDYALFEHARKKSTFCCVRCQYLYSITGRPELGKCPQCGHENARLKF
jgi:rubrerythrin